MNEQATVVKETLLASVTDNPSLAVMDFGNVIVRRDYESVRQVKIIGGGGSGHEPAFSGYVGKGMLTAAIQGEIFNSPSTKIVLRTIKELCLRQECAEVLLIVRNNNGNRLNFGLAAERAKNDGVNAKMLLVDDNCYRNKDGLSGIILIQKIAGAMADSDKTAADIFNFCQAVEKRMASVLLCLKCCKTPPKEMCSCVDQEFELEIGSGIHGERGIKRMSMLKLSEICNLVLSELRESERVDFKSEVPIVLMVNNLGTLPKIEEMLFYREIVKQLHEMDVKISRAYCGRFFTSLDMSGVSVTVLEATKEELVKYLDAPCETSGTME